jgi:hypothetical protein
MSDKIPNNNPLARLKAAHEVIKQVREEASRFPDAPLYRLALAVETVVAVITDPPQVRPDGVGETVTVQVAEVAK